MAELFFFFEATLISFLLTWAIIGFSRKRKLLDVPNDRSSHRIPKPRLGGIAIVVAFYATVASLYAVGHDPFPTKRLAAGFLAGGGLLALMGIVDDIHHLNARLKLVLQVAAASAVVASGGVLSELKLPLIGLLELGWIAVPVTLLWIVAIINFYNFIDGLDGLAAGVGMIAALFLVLIGTFSVSSSLTMIYLVLAGSCLGFLRYNFPPARIFMGDTGSTFIGYSFAVLAIIGSGTGVPVFVTLLLLAGVIGDAALTLIKRIVARERIFIPHRTHYYQRLTSVGFSHKQITLLEYLVTVLLGVSALFIFRGETLFVTVFSGLCIVFFLWALLKIRSLERGGTLFPRWRAIAIALSDLIFIAVSYLLSYYLRLNFQPREAEVSVMLLSLPIVLVIRTALFYHYGLYRGVWRYTTFDDIVRIVKAVSIGSLIMIVSFTLLFRFSAFPRSVFVIDWFILTVFIGGSRIATRWFHELPAHEELSGKRIAIGGTGHAAEVILHTIKRAGGLIPVGYLDDRTGMTGKIIHGLEVLGPYRDIERLVDRHKIDELYMASPYTNRIASDVRERLTARGVTVHVVSDTSGIPELQDLEPSEFPCREERVLVAGNGTIVSLARDIFADASEIVTLSNEGPVLETDGKCGGDPPRCSSYLGLLGDREAVDAILAKHRPASVFAHFRFTTAALENRVEAYVRTVLVPLGVLASAVHACGGIRMYVIHEGPDESSSIVDRTGRSLERFLKARFDDAPERLSILRAGMERPAGWWGMMLLDLVRHGGGLFRVIMHRETSLRYSRTGSIMERIEADLPYTPGLLGRMTHLIDQRDEREIISILEEAEGASTEEPYE
jgi:UDP-GlcNAc:undecaprenyl-phosphate GlcNAc-1-phosphate transferase